MFDTMGWVQLLLYFLLTQHFKVGLNCMLGSWHYIRTVVVGNYVQTLWMWSYGLPVSNGLIL